MTTGCVNASNINMCQLLMNGHYFLECFPNAVLNVALIIKTITSSTVH